MTTIAEDRVKLSADGLVYLYRIDLLQNNGSVFLKDNNTVTWQTKMWEGTAIKADGFEKSADEEVSRPKLYLSNENSRFNPYVKTKVLEGATVTRYRVLREHLEADLNIYEFSIWQLAQVLLLNNSLLQCELRKFYDTPRAVTPARMFIPPDFPTVRLS